MSVDIQKQKPFSVNQIESTKPSTKKSSNVLSGYFANSMNGGHNKVIAFKKIMAGERHNSYRLKMNISMLTPLTPTYQNLKMTIRAYFVPNSRVWTNAEKYTAQKGGASVEKVTEIPNLGGKMLTAKRIVNREDPEYGPDLYVGIQDTTMWRDTFASSYIPRIGMGNIYVSDTYGMPLQLPAISVLPLRGRVAIYNDMERNKEYDEEITEYKGDNVSSQEYNSYIPNEQNWDFQSMRAKREDNYYTNYRTEIQGFEDSYPPSDMSADKSLINWASWESKIAEARSQAENAQRNDWDIIAEIRGSKKLTEGKVQKIAEKTFNLNYSAITQNTYNNNEEVREDFRVMGKQGAYSYTEIDLLLYSGVEFIEEGYLHIIGTVSADTVFENGIDRNLTNVTPLDEYRPDMIGDKLDILKMQELGTSAYDSSQLETIYSTVIGFKRKYSEYFKLPNIIAGDMTSKPYFMPMIDYNNDRNNAIWTQLDDTKLLTNATYQFFEEDASKYVLDDTEYVEIYFKKYWKDYTDLMINKNQAIRNKVMQVGNIENQAIAINGQNQIFFVGVHQAIADLPIDDSIKDNYTKWGEH